MTYKLSPRRVNLFMECERCFWLRVNQGVKRPTGPFPSLPGGMDDMIKTYFDKFRSRGEQPPELDEAEVDAIPLQDTDFLAKARKWQTEPKYHDEANDVLLRGGVDDLLRREDGSIIVLDYKTRGYPPKDEVPDYYARQVNLYNLILRENGYDTADHGLLLYYYPDQIQDTGEVLFENEVKQVPVDIEAARKFLRDAAETLNGSIPDHNPDCDFCDWNAATH
jgi:CRISPR/Cas system-associated exonuclease Cas4 (RecB family)